MPLATITKPQNQRPKALEPINQPTLQDFISEAQKLSQQKTRAQAQILGESTGDVADAFSRRLFSQNVGSTSGAGQELARRSIREQSERLEPYALRQAAELGERELDYRRTDIENLQEEQRKIREEERLEAMGIRGEVRGEATGIRKETRAEELGIREAGREEERGIRGEVRGEEKTIRAEQREVADREAQELFGLVQSGQITGDQARQTLINRGINPETYMTPEQNLINKQVQAFQLRLSQSIKDPAVREMIDNMEELDFFLENGKTFEDEVADIMRTRKKLAEWRTKLPALKKQISHYNDLLDYELTKGTGWVESLFGGKRDDSKIANWREKKAAIEQAINEIEAGKIPVI